MMISTIFLAIAGVFGGVGQGSVCSPKDEVWLRKLADALKRFEGKVVEKLSNIVASVFGAILSFLRKVFGSVAEHT